MTAFGTILPMPRWNPWWTGSRYRRPAGEKLTLYEPRTRAEAAPLSLKSRGTPSPQRRITRWEHEDVLEAMQKRLYENLHAMRTRRETP